MLDKQAIYDPSKLHVLQYQWAISLEQEVELSFPKICQLLAMGSYIIVGGAMRASFQMSW
jgi:hypothetical protein